MCLVAQSCLTDCTTPWTVAGKASLFTGILHVRKLEWVAISSTRRSSQPRDQTQISCISGRFFTDQGRNFYPIFRSKIFGKIN